jgi:hypothetical protein
MRFALLEHDHPFLHRDLLLEAGEVCWTWRLLDPPETEGPIAAERIADHRRLYLDYAGPVSGNRGVVLPVDGGELIWISALPGRVRVQVAGKLWSGQLLLEKRGSRWEVRYQPADLANTSRLVWQNPAAAT